MSSQNVRQESITFALTYDIAKSTKQIHSHKKRCYSSENLFLQKVVKKRSKTKEDSVEDSKYDAL